MIRSLSMALLSCALFFGLGEIGARWWIHSEGSALDKTRAVLMIDPHVGWRQRPNLDTTFIGRELQTDDRGWRVSGDVPVDAAREILVLGPSSTFGWGVDGRETYAAQLQKLLPGTQVHNAGQIGFSSEQGMRLFSFPDVEALKPDFVIIAYGINDLDLHRFHFQSDLSDADAFSRLEPSFTFSLMNAVGKSALLTAIQRAAGALKTPPVFVPSLRVPPAEFGENIKKLVRAAHAKGSEVVLLTTSTNLPYMSDSGGLYSTKALYERARETFNAGDVDDALRYLEQARVSEPARIRNDIRFYNDALRTVAPDEGVPLLDLEKLFVGRDREALFVDPIHFSAEGNRLIAEGLRAILSDIAI